MYRIVDEAGNEISEKQPLNLLSISRLEKRVAKLRAAAVAQSATRRPLAARITACAEAHQLGTIDGESKAEPLPQLLKSIEEFARTQPELVLTTGLGFIRQAQKPQPADSEAIDETEALRFCVQCIFAGVAPAAKQHPDVMKQLAEELSRSSKHVMSEYDIMVGHMWIDALTNPHKEFSVAEPEAKVVYQYILGLAYDGLIMCTPPILTPKQTAALVAQAEKSSYHAPKDWLKLCARNYVHRVLDNQTAKSR